MLNKNEIIYLQKPPHVSLSQASYKVSILKILENADMCYIGIRLYIAPVQGFIDAVICGSMTVDNYIDDYLAVRAYNPHGTCHSWTPDPRGKGGWRMRLTSNYVFMANYIMDAT